MGVAVKPTTRNGDKHMKTTDKYVGLDVHKDTTVIAVAEGARDGEVRVYGSIPSDLQSLERVLRNRNALGYQCKGARTRLNRSMSRSPRAELHSWSA